jgi:hypothetical protein
MWVGMIGQVDTIPSTAAFLAFLSPCVVDEDSPHRKGRCGDKVGVAMPFRIDLIPHEPKERFMHEGGWLQRLPGPLVLQVSGGNTASSS